MAEFEINKAVSEKLGYIYTKSFDPCNNVEQAWEIMMKYNICVTQSDNDLYDAFADLYCVGPTSFCYSVCKSHSKPLVSAMLVFLEL